MKTSFKFGEEETELRLIPENEKEKRIIELAFNGYEVTSIGPSADKGIILVLKTRKEVDPISESKVMKLVDAKEN